jgi:hypothetical protein
MLFRHELLHDPHAPVHDLFCLPSASLPPTHLNRKRKENLAFFLHARQVLMRMILLWGGGRGWRGVIAWRKNLSQDYCTQFCGEILQLASQ